MTKKKRILETKEQAPSKHEPKRECGFCEKFHRPSECLTYGKSCDNRQKVGHFTAVCRSNKTVVPNEVRTAIGQYDMEEIAVCFWDENKHKQDNMARRNSVHVWDQRGDEARHWGTV